MNPITLAILSVTVIFLPIFIFFIIDEFKNRKNKIEYEQRYAEQYPEMLDLVKTVPSAYDFVKANIALNQPWKCISVKIDDDDILICSKPYTHTAQDDLPYNAKYSASHKNGKNQSIMKTTYGMHSQKMVTEILNHYLEHYK